MARYIDTSKVTIPQGFFEDLNVPKLLKWLNDQPTADVVPKSEVDNLEYTLLGVMHSVDKWLEGDELKQHEVNRAAIMREKTLQIVEGLQKTISVYEETSGLKKAKAEVARDIFAEIKEERRQWESVYCSDYFGEGGSAYGYLEFEVDDTLARLERKYTEKINNENH